MAEDKKNPSVDAEVDASVKENKKNDPDRLEMNKYCRFCRKHTLHKETK